VSQKAVIPSGGPTAFGERPPETAKASAEKDGRLLLD
jgi:hypothetical protein